MYYIKFWNQESHDKTIYDEALASIWCEGSPKGFIPEQITF